jgi:hypothetical protein
VNEQGGWSWFCCPQYPISPRENLKVLLQTFKNSYSSHSTSLPETEGTWDSNSVAFSCQSSPVIAEFASSQQKKWIGSAAPRTSRQTIPTNRHSATSSWYHEALVIRPHYLSCISCITTSPMPHGVPILSFTLALPTPPPESRSFRTRATIKNITCRGVQDWQDGVVHESCIDARVVLRGDQYCCQRHWEGREEAYLQEATFELSSTEEEF